MNRMNRSQNQSTDLPKNCTIYFHPPLDNGEDRRKHCCFWNTTHKLILKDCPLELLGEYPSITLFLKEFKQYQEDKIIRFNPRLLADVHSLRVKRDYDPKIIAKKILRRFHIANPNQGKLKINNLQFQYFFAIKKAQHHPLHNIITLPILGRRMRKVRSLQVESKSLVAFTPEIQKLKKLEVLHYNCHISSSLKQLPSSYHWVWKDLASFPKLQYLHFEHVAYDKLNLSEDLFLGELLVLDLEFVSLKHIPQWITRLPKLKVLSLKGNQIHNISQLDGLKSLVSLDLSMNSLTRYQNILSLSSLKFLTLEKNHLTTMQGLDRLNHLQTLNVSRNWITEFNFKLLDLSEIFQINADFNRIFYFPLEEGIKAITKCEIFTLDYNHILDYSEIPEMIELSLELRHKFEISHQKVITYYRPNPFFVNYSMLDWDGLCENISTKAQKIIQQKNWERFTQYFSKPISFFIDKLRKGEALTEDEEDRVVHEFSYYYQREILENILPVDHPIIQKITHTRAFPVNHDPSLSIFF